MSGRARRKGRIAYAATERLTDRQKARAGWEGPAMFTDAVQMIEEVPLEDERREQARELVRKGYGDTIANAVVAAADGYFNEDYPPTLRSWWLAVALELRGRTPQDIRQLGRLGVRTLGHAIL